MRLQPQHTAGDGGVEGHGVRPLLLGKQSHQTLPRRVFTCPLAMGWGRVEGGGDGRGSAWPAAGLLGASGASTLPGMSHWTLREAPEMSHVQRYRGAQNWIESGRRSIIKMVGTDR